MLRVKDIAERFGVTHHTILHWIAQGVLRTVDVSRNSTGRPQWRISPEAISEFEAARMTTPAPVHRSSRRRHPAQPVKFY